MNEKVAKALDGQRHRMLAGGSWVLLVMRLGRGTNENGQALRTDELTDTAMYIIAGEQRKD